MSSPRIAYSGIEETWIVVGVDANNDPVFRKGAVAFASATDGERFYGASLELHARSDEADRLALALVRDRALRDGFGAAQDG